MFRRALQPLRPGFPDCALLTSAPLGTHFPPACSLAPGAGSGIGRAVSVRLAREGAAVAACDLDGAAAQETVQLLGGSGSEGGAPRGTHTAFQADVSEAGAARRLLEQVQVNLGHRLPPSRAHSPPPPRVLVLGTPLVVTPHSRRPALLAHHLSSCPVRASQGMNFCSTCLKMTGTES